MMILAFCLWADCPLAKGRTNVELREQFILADGVSQSMAAFTPRRSVPNAGQTAGQSNNSSTPTGASNGNLPPYMSGQGPIIKVNTTTFHQSASTIHHQLP